MPMCPGWLARVWLARQLASVLLAASTHASLDPCLCCRETHGSNRGTASVGKARPPRTSASTETEGYWSALDSRVGQSTA